MGVVEPGAVEASTENLTGLLRDLAAHLNMTRDEFLGSDSEFLFRLVLAAKAYTESQLGFQLDDAHEFPRGTPQDVRQAVLMLAAHWFAQRESVVIGVSAQTVPHGFDDIIRSHRSYTFG